MYGFRESPLPFVLNLECHFATALTAGIHNPKKENDHRCLIPQEDFCGLGYAYIFSANICQAVHREECTSSDILPFKTKKECEFKCLIDNPPQTRIPVTDISSRPEIVQPEFGEDETKLHSEQHDNFQKNIHLNNAAFLDKLLIKDLVEDVSETTTTTDVDLTEKNSNLEQNDYDWYDYKDYMVNNVPRCEQPREVSMCRGFWPRWWFNKTAEECQEFTYGGCGRDDQTTNNFLTHQHCLTVCYEIIPCHTDESKSCNVSTTECATPTCPAHQDAICQVEPCTCKANYIDDFGDQVICTTKTHQHNGGDYEKVKPQMWVFWLCGVLTMIVLILCIICCYRCLRPSASYQNFQQNTSISLDTSEGNFTPRKVFEKPAEHR